MEKQKGNKLTRTTFKEKINKKRYVVITGAVNRQHWYPGRPNHTHNPPNNFPQHRNKPKGRMYVTVQRSVAYVHDFWPKTCIYREDNGKK